MSLTHLLSPSQLVDEGVVFLDLQVVALLVKVQLIPQYLVRLGSRTNAEEQHEANTMRNSFSINTSISTGADQAIARG